MIKLDAGNVLLKPSHRRQLMAALRRTLRLGERLGNFVLTITMQRIGRFYEMRATVHGAAGRFDFDCRSRRHDWHTALREISRALANGMHAQCLQRALA